MALYSQRGRSVSKFEDYLNIDFDDKMNILILLLLFDSVLLDNYFRWVEQTGCPKKMWPVCMATMEDL